MSIEQKTKKKVEMIFVFLHTQKTFSITNKHTFYRLKRDERRVERVERKRGAAQESR